MKLDRIRFTSKKSILLNGMILMVLATDYSFAAFLFLWYQKNGSNAGSIFGRNF